MFESLSNNLAHAIKTLRGQNKITELNIATTAKEIRRSLIQADVHYKVAKQVTNAIKAQALGRYVLSSISPGQLFTKIVSEELSALMGSKKIGINLAGQPAVMLIAGLQGSGKTTLAAKLALRFKNQNKGVLLVACDIYRPAAIEQLQVLGKQVGVDVYAASSDHHPLQIAQQAIQHAQSSQKQVVIIDTAGRQAIDQAMMQEIKGLKQTLQPSETLLVVDAMTGQDAVNTAQAFNEQLGFDGVVLTKLDGDSRGGAALSIRAVVDKPIKFIGTGEKLNNLDEFHPDRMAKRMLGLGDVLSLVERAEQAYDEQQVRRMNQQLRKNQFDFNDFLVQLQQLKKMGNIKELMAMVLGMNNMSKKLNLGEEAFTAFETIIGSMTPQERAYPHLLSQSRRQRIAQGSGMAIQQVNRLLNQFDTMRQMIKKGQTKQLKDRIKFPS